MAMLYCYFEHKPCTCSVEPLLNFKNGQRENVLCIKYTLYMKRFYTHIVPTAVTHFAVILTSTLQQEPPLDFGA